MIRAMEDAITIWIYGFIGEDVTAEPIVRQLQAAPHAPVTLRINSGGGSVYEANAIFSALRRHRGAVRVEVDGVAASAASYIAMAGDTVTIADNAVLMIHNPWVGTTGTAADMRKNAEALDRIANNMRDAYAAKSGMSATDVSAAMAEESWFTAKEALAAGLVDEIMPGLAVAASITSSIYANAPEHIQRRIDRMQTKPKAADGGIADYLSRRITQQATDARPTPAIRTELATAADLDEAALAAILDGAEQCPALAVLQAFAGVLEVDIGKLTAAGENTGCTYSAGAPAAPEARTDLAGFRAAERTRRDEIRAAFRPFAARERVAELRDACLDNLQCSTSQARDLLMDALGADAEPLGGFLRAPDYTTGNETMPHAQILDRNDHFMDAAVDAVLLRNGLAVKEPHAAARDLMGASIADLAATCLSRAGKRPGFGGADATIQAAQTTSDFPYLLENVGNKALLIGLQAEGAATHRGTWTRRGSVTDFKKASRVALSEAPDLKLLHEGGEITYGAFDDAGESIAAETYARGVSITRRALVNDDTGELTKVPQVLGIAAARKESDIVYGILSANPTMRDGNALFDKTNHGNDAGTGTAITVADLGAGRTAMRKQRGIQGLSYLNVTPAFLLVGAERETEALQVLAQLQPDQPANAVPEWIRGLQLIVDPRLDDIGNSSWFLAGNPSAHDTVEVAYLDGAAAPKLTQEEGFDTLTMKWRVVFDFGAAALDWRALYRNPGQ